jgi:hypothetical protein
MISARGPRRRAARQERLVDAGFGEGAGAHDHLAVRALREQRLRARSTVRTPPPTRAHGFRGQHAHQIVVRAAAHGGIQIDHLDFGEGGELAQHLLGAIALQRLLAALDQLDHLAVHQVDAGDDHAVTRTGMPRLSSSSFN